MSGIKAVIFDLDGTLIDSAPDIAAALNAALTSAGIAPLDLDIVRSLVGGGARNLVDRALTQARHTADADTVLAPFLEEYSVQPATLTTVFPGVREALRDLAAEGYTLAVCTNKPEDLTLAILDALELSLHFAVVAGGTAGMALKPEPDLLRKVVKDLKIQSAEAVMVGDSGADVGAARAAGCGVVLVGYGYSTVPADQLGADAVIATMAGVVPYLQGLTSSA